MFKKLIKQLEEENLSTNGTALRDTLRDVGSNVMKQVKEKIESASASASGSRESSRAASLIDFGGPSSPEQENNLRPSSNILPVSTSSNSVSSTSSQFNLPLQPSSTTTVKLRPELRPASSSQSQQPSIQPSIHQHPRPDQPDISKIQEQLVMIKRERDSLHLRNSQFCNLIEDLKRELSEERSLRKDLEEEYKRRNEDIAFKVLLDKNMQTDKIEETVISVQEQKVEGSEEANESKERDNDHKERDTLMMMKNAELSNVIQKLKLQISQDSFDRKELENELKNVKDSLKDKEFLLTKRQQDFDRLQQALSSLESTRDSLQQELAQEKLERQQEHKRHQELQHQLQEEQAKKAVVLQEDVIPVSKHNEAVAKLEDSITEKNKTIRLQQQRITDIKKSIQRGDFVTTGNQANHQSNHQNQGGYWSDSENHQNNCKNDNRSSPPATLAVGLSAPHSVEHQTSLDASTDHAVTTLSVNFEYLKNVIYKFITSSDYESQKQLIKAIATLLQFNREQETAVRETLDWRNSWVASIPLVGSNLKPVSAVTSSSSSTTAKGSSVTKRNRSRSRGKK